MKRIFITILAMIVFFPIFVGADSTTGGDVQFDIQPKEITTQNTKVSITFKATIYDTLYLQYCGANVKQFRWGVYEIIPNKSDQKILDEYQTYTPYDYNTDYFDLSRQVTLSASSNQNRQFYGVIRCFSPVNTLGHDQVSKSSLVAVTQKIVNTNSAGNSGSNQGNPGADLSFKNPLQTQTIYDLMNAILKFALEIGIPIAVVMIIYAGILFVTSRGNPSMITKARTILLYAVIGLAIILIGKGFLTLIQSILD